MEEIPYLLAYKHFDILQEEYNETDDPNSLKIYDSYEHTLPYKVRDTIILDKTITDPKIMVLEIKKFLISYDPIYIHQDILYKLAKQSKFYKSMRYIISDGRIPLYDTLIGAAASTDNDQVIVFLLMDDRLRISSAKSSYKDVQLTILRQLPWTFYRIELQRNGYLSDFLKMQNIKPGSHTDNVYAVFSVLEKHGKISDDSKQILKYIRKNYNLSNEDLIDKLNFYKIPRTEITKGTATLLVSLAEAIDNNDFYNIKALRNLIKISTSVYNLAIYLTTYLFQD